MSTIEQKYIEKKNTPSDINEHLETLFEYAKKCETVTEFGVRNVVSSFALAHANPKKLTCVDIETNQDVEEFIKICKDENVNMEFIQANTLIYDMEETDMLFIDTLHSFNQLSKELERHHSKVKKYLLFHDTISFGYKNEDDGMTGEGCGLVPAIKNFLKEHTNWKEVCTHTNNNGLSILKNTNNVE